VGILRQLAKLLQHLRRVAARPAVDPVGRLTTAATTAALRTIVAAAAPTIVVAVIVVATIIVVQGKVFLNPASPLGTEPAG
jgi:hypothetical protein